MPRCGRLQALVTFTHRKLATDGVDTNSDQYTVCQPGKEEEGCIPAIGSRRSRRDFNQTEGLGPIWDGTLLSVP